MASVKEVRNFADFKVQLVTSFPDMAVYITKSAFEARGKDEVWFFDTGLGAKKIQFVTSFPDIKVQYVNSKMSAGWKNKTHRLQGQIA